MIEGEPGPAEPTCANHAGWLLAIALLATACGGPQASSAIPASEVPDGSPTTTVTPASTSAATVAPTAEPPPQNIIAWILGLAPGSPEGPPEFSAYRQLVDVSGGGCVTLAEGLQADGGLELQDEGAQRLYSGVAEACLAAFHGKSELWGSAAATFAALEPPTSCMDVAAYRVYEELVRHHQQNPDGKFVALIGSSQAKAPPCPEVTQLVPDHGPRGTIVQIIGFNLDHMYELRLFYEDDDGRLFDRRADYVIEGDALVVTVQDDANIALWACIVPQGAEDWNGSGKLFTFEPLPGESAAPIAGPLVPTALCPPESVD
jgi:hypothetical protein